MDCSSLPLFLEGDLPAEAQASFDQHLARCAACQTVLEAEMQLSALGAVLAQRPDRPHAVDHLLHVADRRSWRRVRQWYLGGTVLAAATIALLVVALPPPATENELVVARPETAIDDELVAALATHRSIPERLPYPVLDRHREFDITRAGPPGAGSPSAIVTGASADAAPGERISMQVLAALELRGDHAALVAALIANGDVDAADAALRRAGAGDRLDVERAIIAQRRGQPAAALTLLDQVLARAPRNPQATWNRAVALDELDLPLAAAEAFDVSAALAEPGWSVEAVERRDALRRHEDERATRLTHEIEICRKLRDGVIPDLDLVRRHVELCRPSLYVAAHQAATRDDVLRLAPVARAIDEASGDTASSALIERIAASDFKLRAPYVALYRQLLARPAPAIAGQARIVEQLRASGQSDLLLGALLRVDPPLSNDVTELVRLARASRDPYFEEIATEHDAEAKLKAGKAIEAELELRQAVERCATRDVELHCAYLEITLVQLYLARHRPAEATAAARVALARSRRIGLYWDERVLFGLLGQAAQLERDYAQMRAYVREAALRVQDCWQVRFDQEALSGAELDELRFASARAELDRAPTCTEPLSLARAQIEAELARFDGTAARTAELQRQLGRMRRESPLSAGERARVDAIEGRLMAQTDPAAARVALGRAIAAADAVSFDDVEATKARNLAYRSLLVLGAGDSDAAATLALFAAAVRSPLRSGCALGAMVDRERLLLLARDAAGRFYQVFVAQAFTAPDFDPRTLVPTGVIAALAGCTRVDVLALPPLYGQPRLLPAELAWSYRGPAGSPQPSGTRPPAMLTIEDARPPAQLGLPALQSPSHAPRDSQLGIQVEELILRGAEATPDRVRKELARADFAEIHAHGFVDLGISDVSLIALSPDAEGSFALTARVIAGLKLERAPFITLAACDAAYTAPYLHEPWSLPFAFLLAGARGVLAPATVIPDKDAEQFFRDVGDQLLRGADPAVVLRDLRIGRHAGPADWVSGVVLFD